jgi:hypothetical protein
MNTNSHSSGTGSSTWTRIMKKIRKFFYYLAVLIIIFSAGFIYWKFFYTYSEGYRAGLLQKFSNKGTIFKTHEGEMILSSVSSTSNVAIASEKFFFTVKDENLKRKFDTLQGEIIIVHYLEKNGTLPWRGDSRYLVDSVKIKREP